MSLKSRIEKLEDDARNLPDLKELIDLALDYKDGQPPVTVKVTQQVLDDIEKIYGHEAQARESQLLL